MYIWETHQLLIIRDGILGNWIWLTICATKSLRWVGVAHISMSESMYIHVVKRKNMVWIFATIKIKSSTEENNLQCYLSIFGHIDMQMGRSFWLSQKMNHMGYSLERSPFLGLACGHKGC